MLPETCVPCAKMLYRLLKEHGWKLPECGRGGSEGDWGPVEPRPQAVDSFRGTAVSFRGLLESFRGPGESFRGLVVACSRLVATF